MPCSLVSIASDSGSVPDGTKPLPDPMLTDYHQGVVHGIYLRVNSLEMLQISILVMSSKKITAASPRGQWVKWLIQVWVVPWHSGSPCWCFVLFCYMICVHQPHLVMPLTFWTQQHPDCPQLASNRSVPKTWHLQDNWLYIQQGFVSRKAPSLFINRL